jgi:hypothetical protein
MNQQSGLIHSLVSSLPMDSPPTHHSNLKTLAKGFLNNLKDMTKGSLPCLVVLDTLN